MSRSLIRSVARASAGRGLGAVFGILLTATISRSLAADDAGVVFAALSATTLLATFSLCGIHRGALRFASAMVSADRAHELRTYTNRGVQRVIIASSITCLALLVLSSAWAEDQAFADLYVAVAMCFIVMGTAILTLVAHLYQAGSRVLESIWIASVAPPALFVLAAYVLRIEKTVETLYVYAIAVLSTGLIALFRWKRLTGRQTGAPLTRFDGSNRFDTLAKWRNTEKKLWVISVLQLLTTAALPVIAALFSEPRDVALLAVATRIALIVSFALVTINFVVTPKIARAYEAGNTSDVRSLARRSTVLGLFVGGPLALGCLIAPHQILMIFGPEYGDARALLLILVVGQILNLCSGPVGFLLTMTGHEADMQRLVVWLSPIFILVIVALSASHGVVGTAVGAAAGMITQNAAAAWLVWRRLGFLPFTTCER